VSEQQRCELCGYVGHDVRWRVVAWVDEVVDVAQVPRFETIARCPDSQACRARVEASGIRWSVRDWTKPTVRSVEQREEARFDEGTTFDAAARAFDAGHGRDPGGVDPAT
jgi:hypothetical protein